MSNADSDSPRQFDLFSDERDATCVAAAVSSDMAAKQQPSVAVVSPDHAPGGNYLSVKEVAAYFGVSPATIWRWCKKGDLPEPIRFSQRVTRWARVDLEQFEARRRAQGAR
ncbi:helix-turn-helix transcriptional regulator [Vannielia litorea]|uniref:helix-turn-helix transcriptional regulator n=1 Tax=Vannielia litorea TaxID=1217970 RepID=UPI001C965978|nr:helix-turn-helix domain-containing protein [Vannielia litorea]MBY6047890.1 helix-turn-helix domain-containing protein [Vannielia litorea]MBY6075304.1 helix-turn-helix domain-containing protein [Vannielia litorea]